MAPRWKRYRVANEWQRNSKEIKTICHFQMQLHIMLLLFFIWVVNWGVHNVLAYEIWCAWEFLPWYNTGWHTHTGTLQLQLAHAIKFTFMFLLRCSFVQLSAYLLIHKFPADLCHCRCVASATAELLALVLWLFIHQLSKWCFKWANKMNYKIFHPIFSPMAMLYFSFFHCGLWIFFSFIR